MKVLQNSYSHSLVLHKRYKIRVIPAITKEQVKQYEESHDNMCRSLRILYEKGLMSKKKYKSVCVNLTSTGAPVQTAKLVYYDKLIAFIKSVDIANIHDFATEFCNGLESFEETVSGSHRELSTYVLALAEMYILVDQKLGSRISFFKHFGSQPYQFKIAIGADGAPFGKEDKATAWLLSFLNVGKHIQSQNDNFLLCGAICSESHTGMKRFSKKLLHDIYYHIEKQEYSVNGITVRFTVELVQSDMKWLATVAGELNNAAYYFSTFGNVNNDNKTVINGSLGEDKACTWHPWGFSSRLSVAQKVAKEKELLAKTKLSAATQRNRLLLFIREQGSRQEYEPLQGKLVDCAYAGPLHNSNNAWQYLHNIMLEIVVEKSKLPPGSTNLDKLPENCLFLVYLRTLQDTLKLTRLVKKVIRWFKDGRKNAFSYRFTGKETRVFCHKFMFIIQCLNHAADSPSLRLAALAFCCVQLRDAISYFSRVEITEHEVKQCQHACQLFYSICALMLKEVTPIRS